MSNWSYLTLLTNMGKIFLLPLLFFTFFIFLSNPSFAQSKILINEFLIDPQPQLVEIFNSGTESADISDWIIDDSGGTTFYTIPKQSVILPNQCLVFSGDFNLNKTSVDTVRLTNNSQQLMDYFSYKSSSGSGISYQRLPDGTNNWSTGSANLGFYNFSTEQACLFPTLTPILTPTTALIPTQTITLMEGSGDPTPTETLTPTSTPTPQSYENIYISEVMINPVTGEKEWVEIYNGNDFSVLLNDWFIDDLENGGSSPKTFSLEINAKSYGIFNLTSSIFNNDGDSVRLLDFNKNLKDDFEYLKTETGKTLGRIFFESDNFCLQEPSKNSANNPCINPTATSSGCTGQACLSPTLSKFQGLINQTPTKNPIVTGRETRPLQYLSPFQYPPSPNILGISDELIINSTDNILLINLLCFLSFSYSLLTIISILFKMKLSYGKNKNFYSPPFHSS